MWVHIVKPVLQCTINIKIGESIKHSPVLFANVQFDFSTLILLTLIPCVLLNQNGFVLLFDLASSIFDMTIQRNFGITFIV